MRRFIFAAVLLVATLAPARVFELCFDSTDTGLVKGDFTLTYYTWDGTTATAVATTAITVTHDSDQPDGCYLFGGFTDAVALNYHFWAEVTSNGNMDDVRFPPYGAAQGVEWTNEIVVPSSTTAFYKDATAPAYTLTIQPSLSADPTGAAATLRMKRTGATSYRVLTGTATVSNITTSGTKYGCDVSFAWASGDLDMDDCGTQTTCLYQLQFVMTYAGGQVHPLPPATITVTNF